MDSSFSVGRTPRTALDAVFSDHAVAVCDQIIAEVRTTLVRKFSWKDEEVPRDPEGNTSSGTLVDIAGIVGGVCRDPKDDMVFECAVKSPAEIILSGDNDVLSAKTYSGIDLRRCHCDRICVHPARSWPAKC